MFNFYFGLHKRRNHQISQNLSITPYSPQCIKNEGKWVKKKGLVVAGRNVDLLQIDIS